MATLYISEYSQWAIEINNRSVWQVPKEPALATQTVAIGTVASSNAFNAATRVVRVHADAICSIKFGADPMATTADARMAAGQTEYFGVNPSDKVSVVSNA